MASSEIDITKLTYEQLQGLQRQTETASSVEVGPSPWPPSLATTPSPPLSLCLCALQEIKNLSMSLNSLKVAQARFTESANSLAAIPADCEGACAGPRYARARLASPRARARARAPCDARRPSHPVRRP